MLCKVKRYCFFGYKPYQFFLLPSIRVFFRAYYKENNRLDCELWRFVVSFYWIKWGLNYSIFGVEQLNAVANTN